jgi:hypothetical protein
MSLLVVTLGLDFGLLKTPSLVGMFGTLSQLTLPGWEVSFYFYMSICEASAHRFLLSAPPLSDQFGLHCHVMDTVVVLRLWFEATFRLQSSSTIS